LREPCFGFRLGSEIELTEAGLVAYVTLNSHDLGAALRNMCRFAGLLLRSVRLRERRGDRFRRPASCAIDGATPWPESRRDQAMAF
jgi:hypothetical protein